MAERRAIKSKIWEDEFFGELGFFDQVVWIGLFSRMADDQGRMTDNPILIGTQLFPYKSISPTEIDASLVTFGSHVIRYKVNGRGFIQLSVWWQNQPMQYAVPSNYPSPDGWLDKYRTTYKGERLVFNWDGMQDTQVGILLYNKLQTLPRISSWMDYVGTLNPNPNPNPNPIPNPNHKIKGNNAVVVGGDATTTTETPTTQTYSLPPRMIEEKIFCAVTNYPTIPNGELDAVINAVASISTSRAMDANQTIEYLRPFFQEAKKRYPMTGRAFWLTDWAVAGSIPDAKPNGKKPVDIWEGLRPK